MKKIIVSAIASAIIAALLFGFYQAGRREGSDVNHFYPETAIVTAIDYKTDIVTATCPGGIMWEFYGCGDYSEGDIVRMLMYDNGTPNDIQDDQIKIVWYAGTIEQFEELLD